ncbi:hypothetical protein B0G81_7970 [Paraburkholderia sp. BL6665CI2N2]|nr:hypothetical protein B0G81_7970 [Paraburkholderia sp. BL6665CI2N2]
MTLCLKMNFTSFYTEQVLATTISAPNPPCNDDRYRGKDI